jgi:hypothetical protein
MVRQLVGVRGRVRERFHGPFRVAVRAGSEAASSGTSLKGGMDGCGGASMQSTVERPGSSSRELPPFLGLWSGASRAQSHACGTQDRRVRSFPVPLDMREN